MGFFDGKLELSVTSASGIEAVTKRELLNLGYEPSGAEYGRISFEGNYRDMARANVMLRTANRVFINIARFKATTFDELFEGIKAIPWPSILPKNASVIVNAKSFKSTLFALSSIQSIAKKAIVTSMGALFETGGRYVVEVVINENNVLVALDTSGVALHKRGYRTFVGEAPLRETLASAIILLSVWKWDRPFIDPFCGSGTLPIEAALIGTNTAPGLNRNFAFENFIKAPSIVEKVKEEAKDLIVNDRTLRISGFDINKDAVSLAMRHAKNAGVDSLIHFQVSDMRNLRSRFSHGVIVTNPPYGERLLKEDELKELYRDFGKVYRALDEWSAYVITSYDNFEKFFGARADKTRKLYNSELECKLYRYLGAPPKKKID
ncbi:MAG: class I SAM-dependent RNA methyltransferase [Clostridia bacterium]|nr:class I SAM-dependent RNA methyltransferase [Clostridia bacterium]